jgi:hypothetical protein
MPSTWSAPDAEAVLAQFTPAESALLQKLQGDTDTLPLLFAAVVAEVRDYIRSGNYELDPAEGSLPAGLHNDAVILARWRYLISAPKFKALQTDERKVAAERVDKKLDRIAMGKFKVEPPFPAADGAVNIPAGAWNSENKIVGRMNPVPRPGVQGQNTSERYSNDNAPEDAA